MLHSLAPPSPTLTRFAGLSAGPQCRGCGPGPLGSHPEGKLGDKSTGAGADLWLCLRSPPAAALRWVRLAFCFPCFKARLAGQQSRGAGVNSLPLGEGGSASAETDEGNAKGFYLSYVETARLSIAFPSSAPSGHLPYPFCPFGTFPPDRGNRPQGKAGVSASLSPKRRFGSFAAVGKGTRSPQGAKSPASAESNPRKKGPSSPEDGPSKHYFPSARYAAGPD